MLIVLCEQKRLIELLNGNQESYDLVKAGTTMGAVGIGQLGVDNMPCDNIDQNQKDKAQIY